MAMSKRCVRISERGLRAITKNCREVSFYTIDEMTDPKDDYERLYHENKVVESDVMTLHCIYQQNPSEDVFKDCQLNAIGDAIAIGMSREIETIGVIRDTKEDYDKIPETIMACHVRVDSLRYTVIQCTLTSFLEGYPLQYILSLKLDESDNEVETKVDDAYEG